MLIMKQYLAGPLQIFETLVDIAIRISRIENNDIVSC